MSTSHFKTSKQAYLEKKSSGHDSQDVIRSLLKTPVGGFFSNLQGSSDLLLIAPNSIDLQIWKIGLEEIEKY